MSDIYWRTQTNSPEVAEQLIKGANVAPVENLTVLHGVYFACTSPEHEDAVTLEMMFNALTVKDSPFYVELVCKECQARYLAYWPQGEHIPQVSRFEKG